VAYAGHLYIPIGTAKLEYELLENTPNCLSNCYLRFRVRSDKAIDLRKESDFKLIFRKGSEDSTNVMEYGLRLLTNVSYFETENNFLCDYQLTSNGTKESCYNTPVLVSKSEMKYVDYNPKNKKLESGQWYYFELYGTRPPKLGFNSVDAIPVIFGQELPFAWWNATFVYRYPIESSSSSVCPFSVNDTFGIDDKIFWSFNTSENKYLYCVEQNCVGGLVAIANETHEKWWENETQLGGGNEPTAVWDSNFKVVVHANDGNMNDSTSNVAQNVKEGNAPVVVDGIFGNAMNFTSIGAGSGTSTRFNGDWSFSPSAYTMEMWINIASLPATMGNAIRWVDGNAKVAFTLFPNSSMRFYHDGHDQDLCYGSAMELNQWYYVVQAWDGSWFYAYINDTLVCSFDANSMGTSSGAAVLGGNAVGDGNYGFDGVIDEFRVSDSNRTLDYILDQYNNGINALSDLGSEQTDHTDVYNDTNCDLYFNGTKNANKEYLNNTVANITSVLNVSGSVGLDSNYTDWVIQTGTINVYNSTTVTATTNGTWFNFTCYFTDNATHNGTLRTNYIIVYDTTTTTTTIPTGGYYSTQCDSTNYLNITCGGDDFKYLLTCKRYNITGTYSYSWDWQNQTYCVYGCYDGECLNNTETPKSVCSLNQTSCGGFNNAFVIPCNDTDGDNIYEWDSRTQYWERCNATCVNGKCIFSATGSPYGECDPDSSQCYHGDIILCRDVDNDNIYEWDYTNRTFCSSGCVFDIIGGKYNATCQESMPEWAFALRKGSDLATSFFGLTFKDINTKFIAIFFISITLGAVVGKETDARLGLISAIIPFILGIFTSWLPVYFALAVVGIGGLLLWRRNSE